jgi:hypothetical protein
LQNDAGLDQIGAAHIHFVNTLAELIMDICQKEDKHYKNFFHYPQTFTHGSVTVENVKITDDLPTSKPSIKLRICYKLFELLPMA